MKRTAKILLALLLSLTIAGGAYASSVQKGVVIIWFLNTLGTRCNVSSTVETASITSEGLEGFESTTSATISSTEPPVTACVVIIYFEPEPL